MSSYCICRAIFEDAVRARKSHPDYKPSWEESWPETLKGVSGKERDCGICEKDLEGTPLPESRDNKKCNRETFTCQIK